MSFLTFRLEFAFEFLFHIAPTELSVRSVLDGRAKNGNCWIQDFRYDVIAVTREADYVVTALKIGFTTIKRFCKCFVKIGFGNRDLTRDCF